MLRQLGCNFWVLSLMLVMECLQGWKHAKRGDPNSPVKLISLDCEMVTCEGDVKDLVRVCAVGSDYNVSTH